jgi:hypothetical protein
MDLLQAGHDYMYLFSEYERLGGYMDALRDVGSILADLGFWDRKEVEK